MTRQPDLGTSLAWLPVLAAVLAIGLALACPAIEVDDSASYLTPARSWARGLGLREADGRPLEARLPAYPLFLGVVIRIAGERSALFSALQAVLHIAAVLLVAAKIRHPRLRAGVASAAILYPPLLTSAGLVLQESLLSLLVAVVFVALWQLLERPTPSRGLVLGGAVGLAALAKVVVLPVAGVAALVATGRLLFRTGVAVVGGVCLGVTLVLLPWGLRNLREIGRFEVTNGNGGENLLAGSVSNNIENWSTFPERVAAWRAWEAGASARYPTLDRYLYRVAIERIAADPVRWSALALERALRFMLPARHWFVARGWSRTASFGPWYLAAIGVQAALFASTLWLLADALRRREIAAELSAPIVVFTHQLVYAVSYASPRYAVAVGPVLFAALGLALQRATERRSREASASA